jgi:hypothetical protein
MPAEYRRTRKPLARLWAVVAFLLFGGAGGYLAAEGVPPLLTDWQIRDTARPLPSAHLEKGSCTSTLALLHICDLTLVAMQGTEPVRRSVTYVFAWPQMAGFQVRALADPAHPTWVSSDLGLAHLLNRSISLALALVFCATMAVWGLLGACGLLRAQRAARAAAGR